LNKRTSLVKTPVEGRKKGKERKEKRVKKNESITGIKLGNLRGERKCLEREKADKRQKVTTD